jgi:hypothetical protein
LIISGDEGDGCPSPTSFHYTTALTPELLLDERHRSAFQAMGADVDRDALRTDPTFTPAQA